MSIGSISNSRLSDKRDRCGIQKYRRHNFPPSIAVDCLSVFFLQCHPRFPDVVAAAEVIAGVLVIDGFQQAESVSIALVQVRKAPMLNIAANDSFV
jgi:hypothetical protein